MPVWLGQMDRPPQAQRKEPSRQAHRKNWMIRVLADQEQLKTGSDEKSTVWAEDEDGALRRAQHH